MSEGDTRRRVAAHDCLNRLVAKRYDGVGTCPASATGECAYEQEGHGYSVGQRTTMTNIQHAVVAWTYDQRGRVTTETRTT